MSFLPGTPAINKNLFGCNNTLATALHENTRMTRGFHTFLPLK